MTAGASRLSRFQFVGSHWQKPIARASDSAVTAQARLDHRLGQADLRRDAEPLVDGAPLLEEACRSDASFGSRKSPRVGLCSTGPDHRLEQLGHRARRSSRFDGSELVGEHRRERRIRVRPGSAQSPFGRKDREQSSVERAAEHDRPVGDGEDLLPELIARPVALKRRMSAARRDSEASGPRPKASAGASPGRDRRRPPQWPRHAAPRRAERGPIHEQHQSTRTDRTCRTL